MALGLKTEHVIAGAAIAGLAIGGTVAHVMAQEPPLPPEEAPDAVTLTLSKNEVVEGAQDAIVATAAFSREGAPQEIPRAYFRVRSGAIPIASETVEGPDSTFERSINTGTLLQGTYTIETSDNSGYN